MTLNLNWREISALITLYRSDLLGCFVDRVIIPERPHFPKKYIKGEWALRLTSRKSERMLFISVRPRHAFIALLPDKGPRASTVATHAVFDMALNKHLKGAKVVDIVALHQERVVIIWFSADGERLGLVLSLIPASPEALLIRDSSSIPYGVLARTRTLKGPEAGYTPPDGLRAPTDLVVREDLVSSAAGFLKVIEKSLDEEALELRKTALGKTLRESLKQASGRVRQSQTALKEAAAEADWQKMGDLLKSCLSNPPPLVGKSRRVQDFIDDSFVEIPCDPKLSPTSQVEKFYSMAKRKGRRLEEARSREETYREAVSKFTTALSDLEKAERFSEIEKLERQAGQTSVTPIRASKASGGGAWLGKVFTSQEGLSILVGKKKEENLELTFKIARGNDVWMHVKGKPGAHVLIPLHGGKSASLDTLLDAAVLAVYYSGGEKWGKTEVDYTFKKYVKRIRDSSEASYTNNKTLVVEPDAGRLLRLLPKEK